MGWTGRIESGRVGNYGVPFLLDVQAPELDAFLENHGAESEIAARVRRHHGVEIAPDRSGQAGMAELHRRRNALCAGCGRPRRTSIRLQGQRCQRCIEGHGQTIEGHTAYRLDVTLPSGQTRTDWIDAKSFLELRYDRVVRDAAGRQGTVSVYYRNHQKIQGLVLPLTIETGDVAGKLTDKMMIDMIAPGIQRCRTMRSPSRSSRRGAGRHHRHRETTRGSFAARLRHERAIQIRFPVSLD